jgi:hypothetical protein
MTANLGVNDENIPPRDIKDIAEASVSGSEDLEDLDEYHAASMNLSYEASVVGLNISEQSIVVDFDVLSDRGYSSAEAEYCALQALGRHGGTKAFLSRVAVALNKAQSSLIAPSRPEGEADPALACKRAAWAALLHIGRQTVLSAKLLRPERVDEYHGLFQSLLVRDIPNEIQASLLNIDLVSMRGKLLQNDEDTESLLPADLCWVPGSMNAMKAADELAHLADPLEEICHTEIRPEPLCVFHTFSRDLTVFDISTQSESELSQAKAEARRYISDPYMSSVSISTQAGPTGRVYVISVAKPERVLLFRVTQRSQLPEFLVGHLTSDRTRKAAWSNESSIWRELNIAIAGFTFLDDSVAVQSTVGYYSCAEALGSRQSDIAVNPMKMYFTADDAKVACKYWSIKRLSSYNEDTIGCFSALSQRLTDMQVRAVIEDSVFSLFAFFLHFSPRGAMTCRIRRSLKVGGLVKAFACPYFKTGLTFLGRRLICALKLSGKRKRGRV